MRSTMIGALAACGLMAGGLMTAGPVLAQSATVVRDGDRNLTCSQMADEAAELSAGMGQEGPGLLGRVTGVARAGAAMLVPGAGLAMAGADALTASGSERREAQADEKRDRWNYLNGLYAGKGCGPDGGDGGSENAPTETASNPAPAVASPPVPTVSARSAIAAPAPSPRISPTALPH